MNQDPQPEPFGFYIFGLLLGAALALPTLLSILL